MPKDREVEVMIAQGRTLRIAAEPRDVFAVVAALKANGHNPLIRLFDEELNDWTCWQPTSEKAA